MELFKVRWGTTDGVHAVFVKQVLQVMFVYRLMQKWLRRMKIISRCTWWSFRLYWFSSQGDLFQYCRWLRVMLSCRESASVPDEDWDCPGLVIDQICFDIAAGSDWCRGGCNGSTGIPDSASDWSGFSDWWDLFQTDAEMVVMDQQVFLIKLQAGLVLVTDEICFITAVSSMSCAGGCREWTGVHDGASDCAGSAVDEICLSVAPG